MTHPLLREMALLLPPLRRLTEHRDAALRERDAAMRQRDDALRACDAAQAQIEAKHQAGVALMEDANLARQALQDEMAAGNARIEQTLTMVRAEYTVLPRFGFHQPLDYLQVSLPPQFGPVAWQPGNPLPLPAAEERFGYPADDAAYLAMGELDAAIVRGAITRHLGAPPGLALLDFGCSSGRVLRHFETERTGAGWRLHGVDVQAMPIEWLRLHFPPEYTVTTGTVMPHLPFEDNSLDCIYGFSVFTHIKYLWDMWLLELRRVLKPGGLLIQTIHTENAWAFYHRHREAEWVTRALPPRITDVAGMDVDWLHHGDIGISQAFWKADVARRNWGRYLDVLELLPPQHDKSFQDVLICRKPGPPHPL